MRARRLTVSCRWEVHPAKCKRAPPSCPSSTQAMRQVWKWRSRGSTFCVDCWELKRAVWELVGISRFERRKSAASVGTLKIPLFPVRKWWFACGSGGVVENVDFPHSHAVHRKVAMWLSAAAVVCVDTPRAPPRRWGAGGRKGENNWRLWKTSAFYTKANFHLFFPVPALIL